MHRSTSQPEGLEQAQALPIAGRTLEAILQCKKESPDSSSGALIFPDTNKNGRSRKGAPTYADTWLQKKIQPIAKALEVKFHVNFRARAGRPPRLFRRPVIPWPLLNRYYVTHRTSVAMSFVAGMTPAGKVCAWLDVSNALDPTSAAAAGVDLTRLLWVRCGVQQQCIHQPAERFSLPEKYLVPTPTKQGLHGGGCGLHFRTETKGLSAAISNLLRPEVIAPRCSDPDPAPVYP
jgi:recA bacterial DNA recombination protein